MPGVHAVELHTGDYANAPGSPARARPPADGRGRGRPARTRGTRRHGLTVETSACAAIPEIVELNIGHSIVARAVVVGMAEAVREMKAALASRP